MKIKSEIQKFVIFTSHLTKMREQRFYGHVAGLLWCFARFHTVTHFCSFSGFFSVFSGYGMMRSMAFSGFCSKTPNFDLISFALGDKTLRCNTRLSTFPSIMERFRTETSEYVFLFLAVRRFSVLLMSLLISRETVLWLNSFTVSFEIHRWHLSNVLYYYTKLIVHLLIIILTVVNFNDRNAVSITFTVCVFF